MEYLQIPKEISLNEIRTNTIFPASLSPSTYRKVVIPTCKVKTVRELLSRNQPFDRGKEPGSAGYMYRSSKHLIRTKALQRHSCLIYPKGDAVVPLNPKVFHDPRLSEGDILMSKDSNVGESVVVDGDHWKNHMFSGGIVRLHPECDRYYFFAFLKHPIFVAQLSPAPRGATITHAKTLWLDSKIPFPNQQDDERVIRYVSVMMKAIIDKERGIRQRHQSILCLIDKELNEKYNGSNFIYSHPTTQEIHSSSRLDTGLYCVGFRKFKHRVDSYYGGSTTLSKMGVKSRRGPNLAESVLGKAPYSDKPKRGWYRLIRPVDLSEYGTLTKNEWLGTRKKLPIVNRGDLILGCEGFEKGRSIVLVEEIEKCTTNFHGVVLNWPGAEMWQIVFVRCFLAYLREHGVVDWVGVGGSGGHMSPEYFDYLPFPKFSDDKQKEIAKLYSSSSPPPTETPTLASFVEWHHCWNSQLGVWELDREMKALQQTLLDVQKRIIDGEEVVVPLG